LLTTRTNKGESPIYLRITMDRKKAELHSGYISTIKDWIQEDLRHQKVLDLIQENLKLNYCIL